MNNELYDKIKETIKYLEDYYLDWQDYIERFSIPRMDYYYFLINISFFYNQINLAYSRLDKWDREDELELFYVLNCIPNKIVFTENIYNNFLIINKLLEKNKEYQKAN